jgi:hypothetical protein
MSRGRRRCTCATRVCTSCSARSTLRERSSSTVTLPPPWRELEVTLRTPSTCMTASSIGSTTSCSTTSGAAPSHATLTLIVGKSTSGNCEMPMRDAATPPKTTVAAMIIQAKTGFLMQTSVIFMVFVSSLRPRRADRCWLLVAGWWWFAAKSVALATRPHEPATRHQQRFYLVTFTFAPSLNASAPRVTSISPARRPCFTSTWPSAVRMPRVRTRCWATPLLIV